MAFEIKEYEGCTPKRVKDIKEDSKKKGKKSGGKKKSGCKTK